MGERTHGLRMILSTPIVYGTFQRLVGARRLCAVLAERHIRASPGARILDVGCGRGDILEALPEVDYVGVDTNRRYIESARARHGRRGRFLRADASDDSVIASEGRFEIVLAIGILHHLDDDDVHGLMRLAASKLAEGGRLVTLDGVLVPGQPRLVRWMLERDRGECVRTEEGYRRLAEAHFHEVEATVSGEFLHIPSSHLVMEAAVPANRDGLRYEPCWRT